MPTEPDPGLSAFRRVHFAKVRRSFRNSLPSLSAWLPAAGEASDGSKIKSSHLVSQNVEEESMADANLGPDHLDTRPRLVGMSEAALR